MAELTLNQLKTVVQRGDIALALGLMGILVVLVMPLPTLLLDVFLAFSITVSLMILMTSLFIERPLEFSSFPTVLLVVTMMRLSLNVASTRLILSHGHEGVHAAGEVIRAFGTFLMGGNFVIGIIVFAILVIINFIVITKGSGRIAEVSARFSLDALPGKQMAIDADLAAGIINETAARERRSILEEETNFYGAMDGSAKFVRGDAIAGLLVTFINIIGGIIIGVVQQGISFQEALHTYTILTVGDGLVSQIPALIVSTAAGMLVSKAGVAGSADKALFAQLSAYPTALGMSSFVMAVMSLLPGIPMFPFLSLAGITGYLAWTITEAQDKAASAPIKPDVQTEASEIPTAVQSRVELDAIRLELGLGLVGLVNGQGGQKLTDQIRALRQQIATEVGFVVPSVRMQDNLQLQQMDYSIKIKEIEVGRGTVRPYMLMCMDPMGRPFTLPGEQSTDPTFGLPVLWVSQDLREQAEILEYTIIDPSTVITTHLSEIIKDNMADLLSFAEIQKLIDDLDKSHQKLINELVPSQLSHSSIQRILQNLVNERISIRDLPTIIEGIAEACTFTRNTSMMTEHVRSRLGRQLCAAHADSTGTLLVASLSPLWEQRFQEALMGEGEIKQLGMAPSLLQDFMKRVGDVYEHHAMQGESPVLLASPALRIHVRSVIERFRPQTFVMSQNEIHPKAKIKIVNQV